MGGLFAFSEGAPCWTPDTIHRQMPDRELDAGRAMTRSPSDVTGGRLVAVVGTGLVGSGWAIVLARGGLSVKLFEAQPVAAASALRPLGQEFVMVQRFGFVVAADA